MPATTKKSAAQAAKNARRIVRQYLRAAILATAGDETAAERVEVLDAQLDAALKTLAAK